MKKFSLICVFLVFSGVLKSQNLVGPGNSVDFDGVNDAIDLGTSFNQLTFPVTIMMWVRPAQRSGSTGVMFNSNTLSSYTNYHGINMSSRSDRLSIAYGNGSPGWSSSGRRGYAYITTGFDTDWIHVTGVIVNANSMKLYVNGIEVVGSYTGTPNSAISRPTTGRSYVGYMKKASGHYFDGEIDEFRVWNRVLSTAEIRENMCTKVDLTSTGLTIAIDFNDALNSSTITELVSGSSYNKTGGANALQSSAPVGDESVFDVGSYSNSTVDLNIGTDSVRVTGLTNVAKGVQFYRINGDTIPSSIACVDSAVLGVYLMQTDLVNQSNFTLSNAVAGSLSFNRTGADESWTASTNASFTWRKEFIRDMLIQPVTAVDIPDTILCIGDDLVITLPSNWPVVSWSDSTQGFSNYFDAPGTFWYTASDQCYTVGDTFSISMIDCDTISTADPVDQMDEDDADGIAVNPVDEEDEPPVDTVVVELKPIYIPTAFSPNNDDVNDLYKIVGLEHYTFDLFIFNRWGVPVFSSSVSDNHWDGTYRGDNVPEGTYMLRLNVRDEDGQFRTFTRSLNLFR